MPKFGRRSKERLKGVDSKLVNVLNEVVKYYDITVIEGLRTQERQDELIAKGLSKAKYSKHTQGKAVDISPYPIDWDAIYFRYRNTNGSQCTMGWRLVISKPR
jgi:uncharacterized protein YcbK (DUF882 family)